MAVAFMWMYLAAAAITGGISFPASWNWAAYISTPTIKLFGLRFWPVVLGNGAFYAICTWILYRLSRRRFAVRIASPN